MEPDARLSPTTLKPWPELKSTWTLNQPNHPGTPRHYCPRHSQTFSYNKMVFFDFWVFIPIILQKIDIVGIFMVERREEKSRWQWKQHVNRKNQVCKWNMEDVTLYKVYCFLYSMFLKILVKIYFRGRKF